MNSPFARVEHVRVADVIGPTDRANNFKGLIIAVVTRPDQSFSKTFCTKSLKIRESVGANCFVCQ